MFQQCRNAVICSVSLCWLEAAMLGRRKARIRPGGHKQIVTDIMTNGWCKNCHLHRHAQRVCHVFLNCYFSFAFLFLVGPLCRMGKFHDERTANHVLAMLLDTSLDWEGSRFENLAAGPVMKPCAGNFQECWHWVCASCTHVLGPFKIVVEGLKVSEGLIRFTC